MLVLTRRPGESILLTNTVTGDEITVRVVSILGQHAKIGIDASRDVKVLREELVQRDVGCKDGAACS